MTPLRLEREDDPRLAPYRDLRARPQRADPQRFVAESEHAVLRLLESGLTVESVLSEPSRAERLATRLPAGVPLYLLEPALLSQVVGFPLRRAVAACARRPAPAPWPPGWLAARPRWRVLLAAGVTDPVNVGLLARDARAFGVDLLLLDREAGDPFARRAIRASMGHVFALPLARVQDPLAALADLRRLCPDLRALGATLAPGATPLPDLRPPPRAVLAVGHEDRGLPPDLAAACDQAVRIPIDPAVDSLNVAAAAAVLLYALGRP